MAGSGELAGLWDRARLRDLVYRYARGADRIDPGTVADTFTPDGTLVMYREPGADPVTLSGRAEIAAAIQALSRYLSTTHVVANHLVDLIGDRATGETYCLAHHIYERDGVRRDKLMSIRYLDEFIRTPDGWRITTRVLHCDWTADTPLIA